MKAALAILVILALVILAALNVSALIDRIITFATGPLFDQQTAWIGWLLMIAAVCIVALVMISRRAYRRLDEDFPNTFDN